MLHDSGGKSIQSVVIEAAYRWFLRNGHNGGRFKAFRNSTGRQSEVEDGSKNLSLLVHTAPQYSHWNAIETSSLPGVHTTKHSPDLHTHSAYKFVHRWYWSGPGLYLSRLETCKEMVELLGQVNAGADGWIFGALVRCWMPCQMGWVPSR